eukprot:c19436_g1_i2.p1 GENE.c19436_g1_i2~~c19436_g1_i2.p1  ORF type:complete len:476 (+),score=103.34 c19436_g1_i2:39-1466(+)
MSSFVGFGLGLLALTKAFLSNMIVLLQLPNSIKNPEVFEQQLSDARKKWKRSPQGSAPQPVFAVPISNATIAKYNANMEELKVRMREIDKDHSTGSRTPFSVILSLLFVVRIACVALACLGYSAWTVMAVGLLQFLVAPYSLFVAFTQAVALIPPLFLSHATIHLPFLLIHHLTNTIPGPDAPSTNLPCESFQLVWAKGLPLFVRVDWYFAIAFLILDQILCVACLARTPLGPSISPPTLRQTLTHAFYGFINCKTYTIIVFAYLVNRPLPILPWILELVLLSRPTEIAAAMIQKYVTLHWALLFYHQHRLAHMPRVYEHAHKQHHYLCDATAFDAHLYGSGQAEEYFLLGIEVLMGCVGTIPTSFGVYVLNVSWANKIGHTRKQENANGVNFHADHHVVHSKNFSIYNPSMDMMFGTSYPSNDYQPWNNLIITKKVAGDVVTMQYFDKDDVVALSSLGIQPPTPKSGAPREHAE